MSSDSNTYLSADRNLLFWGGGRSKLSSWSRNPPAMGSWLCLWDQWWNSIVVQVSSPIMQMLITPKIKGPLFHHCGYLNSPIISEVHGLCYCVVPPITSLPWQPVHPSDIMKAIHVIECFLIIQLQTIVNESHHKIGEKLAQLSRKSIEFCFVLIEDDLELKIFCPGLDRWLSG